VASRELFAAATFQSGARSGGRADPADDWVLAATSGPHVALVLDVIAEQTATSPESLRAACEIRDASFLAEDLRYALGQPDLPAWTAQRVRDLDGLVIGRRWWQSAR
jgi:hypothetical protein